MTSIIEVRRAPIAALREYNPEFIKGNDILREIVWSCERQSTLKDDYCLRFEITETLLCDDSRQDEVIGERNQDLRIKPILIAQICLVEKNSLIIQKNVPFWVIIEKERAYTVFQFFHQMKEFSETPTQPLTTEEIATHITICCR